MGISVIIPFYNSKNTIERAVESVLCQKIDNLEIILIDDGSTDDTFKKLKKYERFIKYQRQENKGVSVARNLGIKISTMPLIAFLDSDDQWLPGKLKHQLKILDKYPDVSLSGTGRNNVDESGNRIGSYKNKYYGNILKVLLKRNVITASSVVLRKKCLNKMEEPFSPEIKYGEDWIFWIKLAVHEKIHICPEIYVNYTLTNREKFLKKYPEKEIIILFKKIHSIIKNNCGKSEIKSLESTFHFSLADFSYATGNDSKMWLENLAALKADPISWRGLIKFVLNIFGVLLLKIKKGWFFEYL